MLLHGYGSNGDELLHLAWALQPSLPTAAFVALNAPGLLPNLANGRHWWPIETFSDAELTAGVTAAAPALDAFLTREVQAAGLGDDRLVLIGFSQGAMLALHVGLRRPTPPAGIVGLSGMLVAPERLAGEIVGRPPVLLVHGTEDDVVRFASLAPAEAALRAVDVPVETHISTGVAHHIGPDGAAATAAFAARCLECSR